MVSVPSFEHEIGIDVFFTSPPGIGGKLRVHPEDFMVVERFLYPPQIDFGRFTIAEVRSVNWETHLLVRAFARQLHISQNRIGFAGTKDKRSVSTRLMSFTDIPAEQLRQVHLKDVNVHNVYTSDRMVQLGDLYGNQFRIIIRDIDTEITLDDVKTIIDSIIAASGFPNFFGVQRFGVIRPVNHNIGKCIVQGDFQSAVNWYVGHPHMGESEETYRVREAFDKTSDCKQALAEYPDQLTFEKAILNKLVVAPQDFVGALTALPKKLLMLFINSFQSYLFNKILSARIAAHMPLNQAVIGDVVLPKKNDVIIEDEYISVVESNIPKVNAQLLNYKGFVSGILFGSDPIFAQGTMGNLERTIIEQEQISNHDFIVPDIPFLSSSGSRRAVLVPLSHITYEFSPDSLFPNKQCLELRFELPKGCYATSLLREIMKSPQAQNY